MATVNKDFKIKSGLIVEGTTGTINGENILTEGAGDDYILDLIGGETLVTSVEATQLEVVNGKLSVKNNVFDAHGAASTAEQNAIDHADALTTDDVAEGSNLYFTDTLAKDAVASALGQGIEYEAGAFNVQVGEGLELAGVTGNEIVINRITVDAWYDANGAAATAETNAINHTNTALEDYTTTADLDTAVDGLGYLKSADLSGYATESYVGTAVSNAVDDLVDGAPGLLDTLNEIAAAINDDANYATTMTTALAGKQNSLTAGSNIDITADTISVTGLDSADISDFNTAALSATASAYDAAGSASAAQTAAQSYADDLAVNYDAAGSASTAQSNAETFATNAINALDTEDIEEGPTSQYFTDARAKSSAADLLTGATLSNITITGNGAGLTITAENGVAESTTDDLEEGEENLYFTDERAIDAVSNADIYPNAVIIDNVAKQVATSTLRATAGTHVGVAFAKAGYRSAEFLVKVAYGDHTEISKVLLTLDVNDNISITEYGIIGTNGSAMTVSAGISGTDVQLLVTTANNNTTVTVVGTLLI